MFIGEFGMHGQGDNGFAEVVGHGQVADIGKRFERILLVERQRVVDHGRDPFALQVFLEEVAFPIFHDEGILMENVSRVRLAPGDMYAGEVLEGLVIIMGGLLAGGGIRIEVAEFDIEDSCLDTVEAGVAAYDIVVVAAYLAMVGDFVD